MEKITPKHEIKLKEKILQIYKNTGLYTDEKFTDGKKTDVKYINSLTGIKNSNTKLEMVYLKNLEVEDDKQNNIFLFISDCLGSKENGAFNSINKLRLLECIIVTNIH